MAVWLRDEYGDEVAGRFLQACEYTPPEDQRKMLHVAAALHEMFPGAAGLDFGAALAFFGLPPLSRLGTGPLSQKVRAAHLVTHMAGHGVVPLDCREWPSHLQRPPQRQALFPLPSTEAQRV